MDGVLVIDKPQGPTSHDVVAVARRALREKRIGHTGTLDPMATGVLPLVIGKATRLSALLSSDEKEYEADVRLGGATATYDAADRLAAGAPPPPDPGIARSAIDTVLESFRGTFEQVPPPFSAKKVAGTPAYKLARKEQPAPLTAVAVTVHALDVLTYGDGLLRLKVRTSAGFYVRALAHDIGAQLGCGAHLEGLRRTRAGVFAVHAAIGLEALAQDPERAARHLVPLHQLLPELPGVRLTPAGARKASHGNPVGASDADPKPPAFVSSPASSGSDRAELVRLLDPDGALIGIARVGPDGLLRPSVVLV